MSTHKDRKPGSRTRARERALQALFSVDLSGADASLALAAAIDSDENEKLDAEATVFAKKLIEGVIANRAEVDKVIEAHSHNWRLERMAKVDRNVLRLAVYELLHLPDVPKRVVLNEAIELAKKFGSEESSSFINGILDKVAGTVRKE